MWVHTNTPTCELIGEDNGLTWVYTNTHTWELIGKDDGLTWVNTNTPTWVRKLRGFTLIHIHGNSIGTDRTRPDQTDRHTLNLSRV
jgi:hypothetical protein